MKETDLDYLATSLKIKLDMMDPTDENYHRVLSDYLSIVQVQNQIPAQYKGVLVEDIVKVAGTLVSIILLMNFERAHVVTSKAFSWIPKISR